MKKLTFIAIVLGLLGVFGIAYAATNATSVSTTAIYLKDAGNLYTQPVVSFQDGTVKCYMYQPSAGSSGAISCVKM